MVWFADEAETQRSAATVTCQWQLELEVQVLTVPSSHAAPAVTVPGLSQARHSDSAGAHWQSSVRGSDVTVRAARAF